MLFSFSLSFFCQQTSLLVHTHTQESFIDLVLFFQENATNHNVESMISASLSPEVLSGDNRFHCETCGGLQDASRVPSISKAPDHLIVSLNRFSYDRVAQRRQKILQHVSYSETISVPVGSNSEQPEFCTYLLYGVVMHSGLSAEHGHYYCYFRHSTSSLGCALCPSCVFFFAWAHSAFSFFFFFLQRKGSGFC
jgi:ubiquitin C-terminal hydrolase